MGSIFGYNSGIREMEDKLDPLGAKIAKPIKDWVWNAPKQPDPIPTYYEAKTAPAPEVKQMSATAPKKASSSTPSNSLSIPSKDATGRTIGDGSGLQI